jgi:signal peptidase II
VSVRRGKEKTPGVNRAIFFLLAGFVVLTDQLTKAFVQAFLTPDQSHPVIRPLFHLTLVKNRGIAFGLFQGGEKILLILITLSIGALILFGLRSQPLRLRTQWGMGLILGGAVGNWIDRIRFGAVIDFLDFRIWPVFNFADTAITLGVGIFLLEFLRPRVP